jgi:hypothetical protein
MRENRLTKLHRARQTQLWHQRIGRLNFPSADNSNRNNGASKFDGKARCTSVSLVKNAISAARAFGIDTKQFTATENLFCCKKSQDGFLQKPSMPKTTECGPPPCDNILEQLFWSLVFVFVYTQVSLEIKQLGCSLG